MPSCTFLTLTFVAYSNLILGSVEAWVHNTRFTETTVYEATIVANAWRAWLLYMCIFHFLSYIYIIFATLHCEDTARLSAAGSITSMAFPIKYAMNKFNCNSDAGFKVASFIWISAIWLTMPVLTILFWDTTLSPPGPWTPGCIPFAQLCNATLWATLGITNPTSDYQLMVKQYGQPQTIN